MAAPVTSQEEPMSRTYQYRKIMKPALERKRRARINRCLDELKELLVGALQEQGESVARLEKADVLELTVRHLHKLRRSQQLSENSEHKRFLQGYIHCSNEVSKYISTATLDHPVGTRIVSHLDQCIRSIESSQLHHQQQLHPQAMPSPMQQGSPCASQLSPIGYPIPPPVVLMSPSMGPSPSGGGLNILTSYTPPSSPISASSSPTSGNGHHQKVYYVSRSSLGGSSASSTGSMSPIPIQAHVYPHPMRLSDVPQQPLDLSNEGACWRPW